MVYRLNGKLVIPESRYEYGLFENSTVNIKYISIDRFLNSIYMESPSSEVIIEVKKQSKKDKKNLERVFYGEGELFKSRNKNGVYDWHVGNYKVSQCLGDVLFCNTGENIQVLIEDVDYKKYVIDTQLLQEVLYGTNNGESDASY